MHYGKVTSRGRTTIPKTVREACGIRSGDRLAFTVEGEHVVLRKVPAREAVNLRGLEGTLDEWLSPEDEAAYRDL